MTAKPLSRIASKSEFERLRRGRDPQGVVEKELFALAEDLYATIADRDAQLAALRGRWDREKLADWFVKMTNWSRNYSDEMAGYLIAAQAELTGAEPSDATLLAQTAIFEMAATNLDDDHRWVCEATDTTIEWCQWCGVHKAEVKDWMHRPQCSVFAAIRATITHADPSLAEQRTSGACHNVSVSDGAAAPVPTQPDDAEDIYTAPDGRVFSSLSAFNHWTLTRDMEERGRELTALKNQLNAVHGTGQRGWLPIESAPRDGTAILAFGIHTFSPEDASKGVMPGDYWWAIILFDVWRASFNGGQQWVFSKDGKPAWSEPTHWMPLPSPPTQPDAPALMRPDAAIDQLRNHQTQLDADGIMVGVSRQAIDEVLTYIDAAYQQKETEG